MNQQQVNETDPRLSLIAHEMKHAGFITKIYPRHNCVTVSIKRKLHIREIEFVIAQTGLPIERGDLAELVDGSLKISVEPEMEAN